MSSAQNENILERYGLTNYEFAVFSTLLRRGACDAKNLSERSKVPTGRIYDVTASLESKGLIDIQKYSRPKLYSPVGPSKAIRNLLERKKLELEALTEQALLVEEELKKQHRMTPHESLFWKIGIGHETIGKFNDRLLETQNSFLFYSEFFETKPHMHTQEILEEAEVFIELQKRGVPLKLLIGTKDKAETMQEMLELLSPLLHRLDFDKMEVKFTETITVPFVVIDDEKVVLKIKNPANLKEFFASIYIWQRKFAIELAVKFEEMWNHASEFSF
ncbi:MAG: TrmB family transcriptional regulator [Candidatus Heimdallarchaeota archaeon]